jgi:phosphate transport system substrate-binding protein
LLLAVFAVLTLFTAACGDSEKDTASDGGDGGGASSGKIVISGSSTVEPISSAAAEVFFEEAPDVDISVDGPGTGDGFEIFCQGETDISDASRAIKEEEAAACEEAGIEFIEIEIGIDGLSVLTSAENGDVECLSFEDLYALIGPESQDFAQWSDAQPLATELGSDTTLPSAPLDLVGPGEESGTYDSFIELVFADIAEKRLEEGKIAEDQAETTRPDYQASSNDSVIIEGITGSDSSLGWVGFAFAEEAGDGVKELEVDGGDGCVAPTAETIADGSYPISRPLFIYVNKQKAEENETLAEFVDFYLEGLNEFVEEVGYVSLPDDRLAVSKKNWDDRVAGTQQEG